MSSLKDVSLKDVGLKHVSLKDVVVPGFEPGSSGDGSDLSANCATTTAQQLSFLFATGGLI